MTFIWQTPFTTTFSMVACDPDNGDLGVVVASKVLAVGAIVPQAQAGAGAVATQSWANTAYGPEGLRLMAAGWSAEEALKRLLAFDSHLAPRQVGLVDARGGAAAFTGERCFEWAGHRLGEGYTCQGNLLIGPETVDAMAETFEASTGPLAERLLATLVAGEQAGGDRRGRQSAALLVVRMAGGPNGRNDRLVDLRVDDDEQPVARLGQLLDLHNQSRQFINLRQLYLFPADPNDLIRVDEVLARELQTILTRAGCYKGPITGIYDEATRHSLDILCGIENMKGHRPEGDDQINRGVLMFLRQRFGTD